MQITIQGTKDLQRSLKGAERKMPQQLNSAINKTLTFTQSRKAKEIAQRLNMTQKNIKKNLRKIKSKRLQRNTANATRRELQN
jgi:SPX domain protein involved in polyphosphate accumulation